MKKLLVYILLLTGGGIFAQTAKDPCENLRFSFQGLDGQYGMDMGQIEYIEKMEFILDENACGESAEHKAKFIVKSVTYQLKGKSLKNLPKEEYTIPTAVHKLLMQMKKGDKMVVTAVIKYLLDGKFIKDLVVKEVFTAKESM